MIPIIKRTLLDVTYILMLPLLFTSNLSNFLKPRFCERFLVNRKVVNLINIIFK